MIQSAFRGGIRGEKNKMDRTAIEKILKGASEKDYIDLIAKMAAQSRTAEKILLGWGRKNAKTNRELVVETEIKSLWVEAQEIICEFNDYGGGPEDEEDQVYDNLYKMSALVEENKVPWKVRKPILDEMLHELWRNNSGLDDLLSNVAEDFCQTTEETRYLADELSRAESGYYKNYAAQLYKDIGDEDLFLQTKLANLRYGSDYIEAAKYFAGKGNHEKELEYIWKGLENCDGRLDELVNYIAPIYRKQKNKKEMNRLYNIVSKTKWDGNIAAVAKQMYEFGKETEDYNVRKKMLLLLIDVCDSSELKKWFGICREELRQEDWVQEYPGILKKIKEKNQVFYLDICMETGKEGEVLDYLQNAGYFIYRSVDQNQYFSKRLFEKYPSEILALYWQDVNGLLRVSNNENYDMAAKLLKKIKSLMKKINKTEEWNRQFAELKDKHKRKKNFMALVQKL